MTREIEERGASSACSRHLRLYLTRVGRLYSEGGLGGDGRHHMNINPVHTEFGELLGYFVSLHTKRLT